MSMVSFSICSFIFVMLFIIFYFSKERADSLDTKIYSYILLTNIFGIMIDIFGYFCFKLFGSESLLSVIISKSYLVYYFLWALLFLIYVYVISFRKKATKNLKNKNFKLITIILTALVVLIIYILPIELTLKENVAYSSGPSVNFVYSLSFIMVGIMLYCLLKNIKKISTKEYIPLLTFMVLSLVCMIIQKTNPKITLMLMCHSIVTCLMYFTIENPDVKMVKELEIAKDAAEKANKAKSEFLSSMSHELRTPLNAIVCFSELLETKEGLDKESKDFAKDIVSASHNLLELVNSVLDISKIETGKMEVINKEYNAKELFNSLSTMVIPRIGDKKIEFKTRLAEDLPCVLNGDTGKIKQIILNLLTNAVKYTDYGCIDYDIECLNDFKNNRTKLIVSVRDTGRGIKEEDINRLFQKFERIDEDRNTTIEGTGLGLAITQSLADLMGGKIKVTSRYGYGSTFTFVFEQDVVSFNEVEEKKEEEIIEEKVDFSNKSILVVDDSKLNLKVAENVLKEYNVNIFTCTSAKECLDYLSIGKYDIILMDIMMPVMNGVEALKEIKKLGVETPVIALTADAIDGQEDKYLKEGFDGYLSKPIDKNELKKVLNKYLKGE